MPGRAVITRRGGGPDLVLVHGWAMNSRVWGAFAEWLAEDFSLHLVDLPGHGEARGEGSWSMAELVTQLLEEVPPAVWLGWSLGGQVALHAALARPARVSRLLLVSTNPRFVAGEGWPNAMPSGEFEAFAAAFDAEAQALTERFLGLMVTGTSGARRTLAELRRRVFSYPLADLAALRDGLDVLRRSDLTRVLPKLEQDALWIAGAADRRVPPVCSERGAGLMPKGMFQAVEDAGHAPFLSHPDEVLRAVLAFLDTELAA